MILHTSDDTNSFTYPVSIYRIYGILSTIRSTVLDLYKTFRLIFVLKHECLSSLYLSITEKGSIF